MSGSTWNGIYTQIQSPIWMSSTYSCCSQKSRLIKTRYLTLYTFELSDSKNEVEDHVLKRKIDSRNAKKKKELEGATIHGLISPRMPQGKMPLISSKGSKNSREKTLTQKITSSFSLTSFSQAVFLYRATTFTEKEKKP